MLAKRFLALTVFFAVFVAGCAFASSVENSPTVGITAVPSNTMTASPTATATAAPIRLTDGTGTEVELAGPAARIISLGPSNTEILFALGAQAQIAGCDLDSDYPSEAKKLAVISDYPSLSVESIVALQPDLVIAAEIISPEQVQSMRSLGLKVFYLANPKTLPDGLFANLRIVGTLTGRSAEADQLVASLRSRFDAVQQNVSRAATSPLTSFAVDATDPAKPYIAGPGSFVDTLIRLAGGRNLGAALSTSWAQISVEEILHQDPDVILLGDAMYGITVESVAARPGWKNLTAVKTGSIFAVDSNLVVRPGPRLADGLETIARLLHPEIFGTG
jgi:iron complex transport system substrate-binding protein